ncbi:MAG: protein phosphatase 2C domain-containing protein, partial [Parasporobacterium sp.]|nr:protein phosphatase 2C domain-containing protein [Parasporobacterium sp.]
MELLIAAHSDIGIKKNTNQDSLLIKAAQTSLGKVCLCVICDGMGGLAKGEMASASVVRVFEKWFENELPSLIDKGFRVEDMKLDWDNIVLEMNDKLCAYANDLHVRMGTTLAALIIFEDHYYIMNIGDSRVYMLTDQLYQLTEDQ